MREFQIAPDRMEIALERRRKTALRYVVRLGLAAALVISGWALVVEYYQFMVVMPALALMLYAVYRRNLKRDTLLVSKTRFLLGEDTITAAGDAHPLTLSRGEITSICENPQGALVVRTSRLLRFMYIRSDLEGLGELRGALSGWMPIQERSIRWIELWPRINQAAALMVAPLAFASSLSASPWVVIPCGLALVAVVFVALLTAYHQSAAWWHKGVGWAAAYGCVGLVTKMVDLVG